ncbi:MAG TPA: 2-dehydropantoate 2-reductase [Candidatus Binatia bacterium]|nr:2-dehydropantoate 2-reductase [Candidatus Binatia bacterium]
MRILVVGAGAVGGYFGGRLLEAGRDVTFLVRPKRAAQLAETGLVIKSRFGDVMLKVPPTIQAHKIDRHFDLVLLSCKAYDLNGAIGSFAAAVGPETGILPLLNGMRHLDLLDERFGAARVLGGQCLIAATVDDIGRIVHLNDSHLLTFGERHENRSPRIDAIVHEMSQANFESRASSVILLEMWEKWIFLATLAGITCLMRSSIGDIAAAGGKHLALDLLEECRSIAASAGFAPRAEFLEPTRSTITAPGSRLTASMLRDMERHARIEADHILGDLLRRGSQVLNADRSLLQLAFRHLKAYEARRDREQAAAENPAS